MWCSAPVFGAGTIGSNVIDMLARQGGWKELTIVDDDVVLPHNLARHVLSGDDVGQAKVQALATKLSSIAPDTVVTPLCEKIGAAEPSAALAAALQAAGLIIDLTASVGAGRRILDIDAPARRACAFFNPAGDSVTVMVEDRRRAIDLGVLEALYLALVATTAGLEGHLTAPMTRAAVSGACRDVTSRIPESRAALLSAAAAEVLQGALGEHGALVQVLRSDSQGGLQPVRFQPDGGVHTAKAGGWRIRLPGSVAAAIEELRRAGAPREVGGCLDGDR